MTAVSFSVPFVKTDGVDFLLLRLVIQSPSMEARLMFVKEHTVPFKNGPSGANARKGKLLVLYVLSTPRVGFNCLTAGETWVEK
jgi:hypothetical protein